MSGTTDTTTTNNNTAPQLSITAPVNRLRSSGPPPLMTPPPSPAIESLHSHNIPNMDSFVEQANNSSNQVKLEAKSPTDSPFKRPRDKQSSTNTNNNEDNHNNTNHKKTMLLKSSNSIDNLTDQYLTNKSINSSNHPQQNTVAAAARQSLLSPPPTQLNILRSNSRSPVNIIHVNKDQVQIWRHPRVSHELQHDITFVIDNDNSIEFHVHRAILNIACKLGNEITQAYKNQLHKHIILSHNDTGTAQQLKLFFEMLFAEDVKQTFNEFVITVEQKLLHTLQQQQQQQANTLQSNINMNMNHMVVNKFDIQHLYGPIDQLIHTAQYFGAGFMLKCMEDILCYRIDELYKSNKLHGMELYSLVLSNELWEFNTLQSRLVGLLAQYLTDSIQPFITISSLSPGIDIQVSHILKLDKLERLERTTLASLVHSLIEKSWHNSMKQYCMENKLDYTVHINNELYDTQSNTYLPLRDKVYIQMNTKS